MARKKSSKASRLPLWLGAVAIAAALLFAAGELWSYLASDVGRLRLASTLRVGDRAHLTRIVGRVAGEGIERLGVPRDSVRESVVEGERDPLVRWRVGLPRDGSPLQVNWAVTSALEKAGGEVLSAREQAQPGGGLRVTMRIGVGGRATHELVVTRPGRPVRDDGEARAGDEPPARLALVLFGFTEEHEPLAREAAGRRETFALALPAGQPHSKALFASAREAGREIVVQIPMEPENYPRVSPGQGALLVSMPAGRIQSTVRRYLAEAGPAVAASNLMGSFATQDEPLVTAMYHELRKAGLTFLHVQPAPRSMCKPLASRQGVAYDEPDVLLDDLARQSSTRALDREWNDALALARERGHLLVLLRATPMSLRWLDGALSAKRLGHVRLVPLSQVVRRPGSV